MKPTHRPLSLLVVDDDADTADSLADLLILHGHDARSATSGADALQLAADEPPDAVVLDLQMPGMDGWDLARRLSAAAKPPLLIAVSGCGAEADRCRSIRAGIHLH